MQITMYSDVYLEQLIGIFCCPLCFVGGTDYVEINSTLQFSPRERSKVVTLTILNDLLLEKEEEFYVSINVVDDEDTITVARRNATVTIVDTDSKF